MLTCSYIGELRNGRKFKMLIIHLFTLTFRTVLFYFILFNIQFELTAIGINSM